jgi:DNA-binding response OmpR family regulator
MTERKTRILVVEDEEPILLGIEENLVYEGYDVVTAQDGAEALRLGVDARPDLILLDLMLPVMSGYDVCRKLRDQGVQTPVIMLTARQDEFDKLHGFEMGADDYVTKPFSVKELLARIRAVLARTQRRKDAAPRYAFGDCVVDMDSRIVTKNGKQIALTRTEFDLLAYFCSHEGKALSREQVMNDVWGTEYYGTQRSLDSFVANLRSKLDKEHIVTLHGVGYKFVGEGA